MQPGQVIGGVARTAGAGPRPCASPRFLHIPGSGSLPDSCFTINSKRRSEVSEPVADKALREAPQSGLESVVNRTSSVHRAGPATEIQAALHGARAAPWPAFPRARFRGARRPFTPASGAAGASTARRTPGLIEQGTPVASAIPAPVDERGLTLPQRVGKEHER